MRLFKAWFELNNTLLKTYTIISDELNTSIFGSTMMQLLTEDLTTDDLLNISINDLTDYLAEHGRGRFADPEALAKTIQKAVWSSYRLRSEEHTSELQSRFD